MTAVNPRAISVVYFAHDLGDAAVWRRVRMLQDGGATVTLAGFHRSATAPDLVEGVHPIDLGRTIDARMARRVGSVMLAGTRLGRLRAAMQGADVVIARQLEMLLLAWLARRWFARSTPLVFECLDIHRMMLGMSTAAAALRRLEGWLLHGCALLIVSSPAFVAQHFGRYPGLPPVRLLENRVLASEIA